MNKFKILREIYKELKYKPIDEYIGVEVPIDISKSGNAIADEIQVLIEEHLNLKVISIKNNNIEGTIAKYGMLSLNFEIEDQIEPNKLNGIQILRENGWISEEKDEEFEKEAIEFMGDIISEIRAKKTYLKIYANSIYQKKKWFREKTYLMKQKLRGEPLKPNSEDKIQIFRIDDMCFTNYAGIWLWKHFYL